MLRVLEYLFIFVVLAILAMAIPYIGLALMAGGLVLLAIFPKTRADFGSVAQSPYDFLVEHHSKYVEEPTLDSIKASWMLTDRKTVPVVMYQEYKDYLSSDTWRDLRTVALNRDLHRCQSCGYIGDRLQAHHLHYTGIFELEFTIDQLQTLCVDCHKDVHQRS